jgi:hypothetical protein
MSNIRNRAAEIALTESKRSDTSEVIDNRSPRIDEYLKLAGLLPADPATIGKAWCGAFVYWCYQQASKEFDGKNPLPRETFGGRPLKTRAEAHKDWIIYQAGELNRRSNQATFLSYWIFLTSVWFLNQSRITPKMGQRTGHLHRLKETRWIRSFRIGETRALGSSVLRFHVVPLLYVHPI